MPRQVLDGDQDGHGQHRVGEPGLLADADQREQVVGKAELAAAEDLGKHQANDDRRQDPRQDGYRAHELVAGQALVEQDRDAEADDDLQQHRRGDEAERVGRHMPEIIPVGEADVVLEADKGRVDEAQVQVREADVDAVNGWKERQRKHDGDARRQEEEVAIEAQAAASWFSRGVQCHRLGFSRHVGTSPLRRTMDRPPLLRFA